MAKLSLRRFDTQAKVSVLFSAVSVLPLAALVFFVLRRFDVREMLLTYGSPTKYAILGSALMTMMLAAAGFGFGLNSAGQKRNDKQQLSWIGFFLGALVLALTLVVLFLFVTRGEAVIKVD